MRYFFITRQIFAIATGLGFGAIAATAHGVDETALSKSDMVEIQATDPYLSDIIKKLENQDDKLPEKFVMQDKILFVVISIIPKSFPIRLLHPVVREGKALTYAIFTTIY